jgi:oligogalacturonide lyase
MVNGDMVQLTDVKDDSLSYRANLDTVNNIVYFYEGRSLKKLGLDNLEEEELLQVPEGFYFCDMSITDKGDYMAFNYQQKIDRITQPDGLYGDMDEMIYQYPLSMILRYDVANKQAKAVWGMRDSCGHTLISPVDPNYILFEQDSGVYHGQRMWVARVDTREVYPLIKQQSLLEMTLHEFFTASGRIGTQYCYRHRKDVPYYLYAEVYVNPDGSDEKRYYYPYDCRPGHIKTNYAETMSVGDAAKIKKEMNHSESWQHIGLMKPRDDYRLTVGLLCHHGTSWKLQISHPHPFFTKDDRYVIYNSDAGGHCNVYMAEADWDKCIKNANDN